jgi:hypothetical protein
MGGWAVASIEEVRSCDGPGDSDWKPLRHHFGIRAFGFNAWVADHAGQELVEEHDELDGNTGGHEEVYAIIRGPRRSPSTAGRSSSARARSSTSPTRRSCAPRSRTGPGRPCSA